MNVIVSIGRNIGSEPMNNQKWDVFRGLVKNEVYRYCADIYFIGTGQGLYGGTTEESFTVIGGFNEGGSKLNLKRALGGLARDFGQECIAVTFANPEFVS